MSLGLSLGLALGRSGVVGEAAAPAGPFTPADIASLALWLDASAIEGLSDGAAVSQWDDLSGNGRNATQATGTKQPLYKTVIHNGMPCVRFDATDDYLATSAFTLASSGATLFALFSAPAGTARIICELGADVNTVEASFAMARDAGNTVSTSANGNGGAAIAWVTTATTTANVPAIASSVIDFTLGGTEEIVGWLNNGSRAGTKPANINNTNTTFANLPLFIGMRNGASFPFGGDLFELLIFAEALSDRDRGQVEWYLNQKWDVYS